MKIAYIYTALCTMGGVDRVLTVKANYMAEKLGYEVYIITESQAGKPLSFPLSPKVKHIDLGVDFDEQYHKPNLLSRYLCYRRLMKEYRRRLTAKLFEIRPDVVSTTCGRDMDFLCDIHDGSKKIGESHISKQFMRNFHLMEAKGFPHSWIARFYRWKQERAIARLDAFVVLSPHDADSWASVRRCEVIPNPLTIPEASHQLNQRKRLISVGRVTEQKGYDWLVEIWAKVAHSHPEYEMAIYGHGPDQKMIERRAEELGISDSFRFYPPTSDIVSEYEQSEIYVMSSRFEGFGLVLVEAMSCGIPVISFDCPYGPSDIIQDGENGYLVQLGDNDAFAERICYLIEHPEERERLSTNGLRSAARYSLDSIMPLWAQLFKNLTNEEKD